MNTIRRYTFAQNPVWVLPLALPIVFFGSQSLERAVLFGLIVTVGLPVTHVISYFAESILPRMLRIIPVLVVSGAVISVVELILNRIGMPTPDRVLLMIRGISVSGVMIWPTLRSPRDESFTDRLVTVLGLTLGFLVGFSVFAGLRLGLQFLGFTLANSLAVGFLLLALGKIAINAIRLREDETVSDSVETGGAS